MSVMIYYTITKFSMKIPENYLYNTWDPHQKPLSQITDHKGSKKCRQFKG